MILFFVFFFFSSRRRHTRFDCDWSSDVCSSDLGWVRSVFGGHSVCANKGPGRKQKTAAENNLKHVRRMGSPLSSRPNGRKRILPRMTEQRKGGPKSALSSKTRVKTLI